MQGNRKTRKIRGLDAGYLVAIANQSLGRSDPNTKIVLATFLALDRHDSSPLQLEQARGLYAEAVAAGGKSDALAEYLKVKPELSLPLPGAGDDSAPSSPDEDPVLDPLGLPPLDGLPETEAALPKPNADDGS